jgi:hypothetical protein
MVCSCLHSSSLLQLLLQELLRSDSTAICALTARVYNMHSKVMVSASCWSGSSL